MYTETEHQEPEKTVLLIGATGVLGGLIAQALLNKVDEGINLRLLVRPGSRNKLAAEAAEKSEVVENEEDAFDGVHTVVSAVQGGPDVIVDTQLEWLRAARAAGARRFIPSDYSMDLFGLDEGENVNSDWRRDFARRAEEERGPVEVVHVLNGCFLDKDVLYGFLGAFDLEKDEAYLWGEGEDKMDFTTYADTAAYVVEAASDGRPLPEKFSVAGGSLTFHELVDETAAGLGRPITVKKLGTLADLDAEIDRRIQTDPDNMYFWLPLMYWRGMLNGKGKLGSLMNAQYPTVHPTGVRGYVEKMVEGVA
ncbi:MAG: NmrA family NAD(P)-binding protein [Rubrobacteraceae bacterium]